jgi:general secretion pathway protein D
MAVTLMLAGCAAEMAYRDGRKLVAQDKVEAGLQKFNEALAADPGNAEYKIAYLQARDAAVVRYLTQADTQAAAGARDAVARAYRQVLALEPANDRALKGLSALEKAQAPAKSPSTAVVNDPDAGLNLMFKKPISIQFKDASLRQVFDVIAKTSNLNFVFDKDVKADQRTSISLKDSTIEMAVHFLLVTNQLERQVVGDNTVLIYPANAGKSKEYQELVVKTFYIASGDAKLIANSLKTIFKLRDVVVDEKLNLIIMRDSREVIRLAEKLIQLQDQPEPEVMLDVEILEIKTSRLLELGVTWPSSLTLTPLSLPTGAGLTIADLRSLGDSNIGITTPTVTLNANKKDGATNILANPRIRVRNREKARVLIGEKVPQITSTISSGVGGFASESVTYVDVGLTLNVEPTIFLNNDVAIKVALEVSNLLGQVQTKSGSVAYQIGTRQASTLLQLRDGENQVLAGLINNEDRSNGDKVPAMGDIPLLGRLFGKTKDDSQHSAAGCLCV